MITVFNKHFCDICSNIQNWQTKGTLSAISYLEYTMLHTNFTNRRYVAEVFVYDNESYADKTQRLVGEYEVSFLFIYFDELWDWLLTERKRYAGKVKVQDIKAFILESLPKFYAYLASIARFALLDSSGESHFTDIEKNEKFTVSVGNYMASTIPVYVESKTKNAKKLAEWFNEQLFEEYFFGDYSHLDFTEKTFLSTDFRYTRFQGSALNNTNFERSMLTGASFRNANMQGCRLDNCYIFASDFSYATLINASFVSARGRAGLQDEKEWQHVGYLPVNFRYADLTNANFTGANLSGADFTGATLTGANFTDAVLDGAIFDNNNAVRK